MDSFNEVDSLVRNLDELFESDFLGSLSIYNKRLEKVVIGLKSFTVSEKIFLHDENIDQ